MYHATDVNVAYDFFYGIFSSEYESAFPLLCVSETSEKFNKPWMTLGLLTNSRNRSKLYRDYFKEKSSKDQYNRYRNLFVRLKTCKT